MGKEQEIDTKVKSWLASKTIWGIVILLAPMISQLAGFDVAQEIGSSWDEIIQVIGGVLALYGRWKANTQIVVGKIKK